MRIGSGFDVHAFDPDGDSVVIGGVDVPHDAGLSGHSDADVLCHAIADALLGAAGIGDLGSNFPATDEWKDASSLDILTETMRRVEGAGYQVGNIDATVIAERPRLSPHRDEMVANLARALGIPGGTISVKATTTDGVGFTGRGEGIAAMAVVALENKVRP